MDKRKDKKDQIGFREPDNGEIAINLAEIQMRHYERNRRSNNANVYLRIAERNLINASRYGKNTSHQYERLIKLKAELSLP